MTEIRAAQTRLGVMLPAKVVAILQEWQGWGGFNTYHLRSQKWSLFAELSEWRRGTPDVATPMNLGPMIWIGSVYNGRSPIEWWLSANDGSVWLQDQSTSDFLISMGSLWHAFEYELEDVLDFRFKRHHIPQQVLDVEEK